MTNDQKALEILIAKDEIRELVLLYSRGVDRKDGPLLRTLYAKDATDDHGAHYNGPAGGYVDFLERSFQHMIYSGHHVCNHLISVDGETGEGEVYAIAYHLIPDGKGRAMEDFQCVRYVDRYKKEEGRWRFAARVVSFDRREMRPVANPKVPALALEQDPSVTTLTSRLFARGPRA